MKTYKCYSINQHNFLRDQGFRYVSSGFNEATNKIFYVYQLTESLSYALNRWSNNK